MKPQSMDTNSKIEQIQISLILQASVAKRVLKTRSLTQSTIRLARRAIQKANPRYNEQEVDSAFIRYHYGVEFPPRLSNLDEVEEQQTKMQMNQFSPEELKLRKRR